MNSQERQVQTKVKHLILKTYMDAWAGIIMHGVKRKVSAPHIHFIYVDLFSYTGFYKSDATVLSNKSDQHIEGSPLIGYNCLRTARNYGQDKGIDISFNCIFIEANKRYYNILLAGLVDIGMSDSIVHTTDFSQMKNGQISVIHGYCGEYIDSILDYIYKKSTFTFVFIDPYGPKHIPMNMVSRYVSCPRTDTIINFPLLDVYRKSGYLKTASLDKSSEATLRNIDGTFGSNDWRDLIDNIWKRESQENRTNIMELALGNLYGEKLGHRCPDTFIKQISLYIPHKERVIYNLVLTTKDPSGAIKLNEIVRKARIDQIYLDASSNIIKSMRKEQSSTQESLFNVEDVYINPEFDGYLTIDKYSGRVIGKTIYNEFRGQTVSKKDIFRFCGLNTDFIQVEVDMGLRYLKNNSLASYSSLHRNTDIIMFSS